jgi:hypothetical protein
MITDLVDHERANRRSPTRVPARVGERLPRMDGVEELLAHLDGQACWRSGQSPGSLGVAVRSLAVGAPYSRCVLPDSRREREGVFTAAAQAGEDTNRRN